jgi:nucleoside-diphosphate-sugar epimerase
MKILVTGATGMLGSQLLSALIKKDYEVAIIIREQNNKFLEYSNLSIIQIDESGIWKKKIRSFQPDIVCHLSAFLSSADDFYVLRRLVEANILFGADLLDALKDTNCKLFINTGSFAEYEESRLNPA